MPDIYTDPEVIGSEVLPPVEPTRPAPPPFVAAPGTGFGYSTTAPSDWSAPQTGTIGGVPVMLPANAQNIFAVQGPPPDPNRAFDEFWKKNYGNLNLDQTEKAIEASMRYEGTRILHMKLAQGASNREAWEAAAPFLFYTPKGSPQVMAQMMKGPETQTWVPKSDDQPAHWISSSGKITMPNIFDKDIKPMEWTDSEGNKYVYNRATGSFKSLGGKELTDKDRSVMMRDIIKARADLGNIDPRSADYPLMVNMIREMQRLVSAAKTPSAKTPAPSAKGAPAGLLIPDDKGVNWRYLGSAKNPKTDRNPANWVKE